ncbi:unnamed protein product, partial [Cyprideis torosa]
MSIQDACRRDGEGRDLIPLPLSGRVCVAYWCSRISTGMGSSQLLHRPSCSSIPHFILRTFLYLILPSREQLSPLTPNQTLDISPFRLRDFQVPVVSLLPCVYSGVQRPRLQILAEKALEKMDATPEKTDPENLRTRTGNEIETANIDATSDLAPETGTARRGVDRATARGTTGLDPPGREDEDPERPPGGDPVPPGTD